MARLQSWCLFMMSLVVSSASVVVSHDLYLDSVVGKGQEGYIVKGSIDGSTVIVKLPVQSSIIDFIPCALNELNYSHLINGTSEFLDAEARNYDLIGDFHGIPKHYGTISVVDNSLALVPSSPSIPVLGVVLEYCSGTTLYDILFRDAFAISHSMGTADSFLLESQRNSKSRARQAALSGTPYVSNEVEAQFRRRRKIGMLWIDFIEKWAQIFKEASSILLDLKLGNIHHADAHFGNLMVCNTSSGKVLKLIDLTHLLYLETTVHCPLCSPPPAVSLPISGMFSLPSRYVPHCPYIPSGISAIESVDHLHGFDLYQWQAYIIRLGTNILSLPQSGTPSTVKLFNEIRRTNVYSNLETLSVETAKLIECWPDVLMYNFIDVRIDDEIRDHIMTCFMEL